MHKFALAACSFSFFITMNVYAQSQNDCESTCSVSCYFGRCPTDQNSDGNYIDATPNSNISQFRQEFSISEYMPGNSEIVKILQNNVGKIIYIDAIMHSDATGGQIYYEGAGKNDPKCQIGDWKENEFPLPGVAGSIGGCTAINLAQFENIPAQNWGTGLVDYTIQGFYLVRFQKPSKFDDVYELSEADVPFHIRQTIK